VATNPAVVDQRLGDRRLGDDRRDGLALDGRPLGRRGAQTRRRLLDATARLLEHRGVRDLRVVDIAREVGTSPATFYQYFRDVEEAVLALAEEVGEDLAPVGEVLTRDWSGPSGLDASRELVEAFIGYWDANRAVLRTRNLAAQEGDQRFRAVRNASLQPLLAELSAKIEESQRRGRNDAHITPIAAASALMSMLERMAAFHADLEPLGVRRDDLVETTARILHQVVIGTS
jgi:AcrR family transcriptional regulator